MYRSARHRLAVLVAGLVAASLTACSSGSGTATESTEATTTEAVAALDEAYAGLVGTPPTTPTTPPPGIDVWLVSCGQQIPACSTASADATTAAESIGWNPRTCDGQLNPDGWGTCIRQAISADADVIIPFGLDCASIAQPFQEAKDAGVTVVGGGGADCNETGGEALWASERLEIEGVDVHDFYNQAGALAASYLIGQTDGQAKVLMLEFNDALWGPWLTEGFMDKMAECADCEVLETLPLTNGDIVSGVGATKFAAAVQQAADANAIWVPVGGWMTAGFSQAVVASGRSADLTVVSSFGDASNFELVANDQGQDAVLGYNVSWGAYGSLDTAIRVLNGEEPQIQGNGFAIIDAENNLPPSGENFTNETDYVAAYEQAWGLG